ncbi:metal-dependent hydrolase [Blastococcus mobilis]|uniref:Inner membrane protein n=1 Tax=Blastococcus mobilis TaxID=1938746 RepID=A0A238Z2L5_9ACTN|nr:metal-dependent hydrolase [Blastococcus mobilis]SNR77188.1 inner membrane protein [Blastococcus mobilis]
MAGTGIARATAPLGPVAAVAVICALDAVQAARSWAVPVVGVLDEPAHLLTAWVLLAALPFGRPRGWLPWALAGSVLIDVDHLPLYLGSADVAAAGGRPFSHSSATLAVLALIAGGARGRARIALLGLATGVTLHLVRDLATGPGVPLFWPLRQTSVEVPYGAYLVVLVAAAALAAARRHRAHLRPVTGPRA